MDGISKDNFESAQTLIEGLTEFAVPKVRDDGFEVATAGLLIALQPIDR
jgi:hypothetical protein